MPGPQLPSARSFLTDLFSSLPAATGHDKNDSKTTSSSIFNPLKDLQPGAQRNIFLTLHVLFPNELLPALNLLDRRLVTRVIIIPPGTSPPTSGPRQREAGPAAVARGAAETAQQDKDERAAQEKTSQAASRHGPGRRQAAHHHSRDLDGNNLLSSLNNSDARNAATDKNSTATAATGSIAVTGRSAAEQQPGVDAATAPAASITGHGGLLSTTRSEDDDATAAAARCHAAGQPETEAAGHSNSGAITSMRPGDDAAAAGARDLTRTTRNEDGEQTTQFQLPVASGGLAVAPSSPRRSTAERRRADASAYCDNHDDERERRAGNVESQSRNSLHYHQHSHQEPNQDPTVTLDPQPCRPHSPSPQDVQEGNLEQGRAQDDQDSPPSHHVVFYVRSASSSTHGSYHSPPPVYEVRLSAWHCTCPAFAFAAFPASSASASTSAVAAGSDLGAGIEASLPNPSSPRSSASGCDWSFGGLLRERGAEAVPPVCKHLLACLLVERAPRLFGVDADAPADGGLVVQRRVSVLEAAGWAAGWGGL
ncbi:hypothetical protein HDK77DRAFT_117916 [Phyllosticta capitalensis]